MPRISLLTGALATLLVVSVAWAVESVQEQRHDLMESSKDAAKPVGEMLKGERAFNAAIVMESFGTWEHVASTAGSLFPEGSETGYDTRAKEAVWTDRAGFEQALEEFSAAVSEAVEAAPQNLEALKAAAGPVFKSCKNCHESYRAEKES